jgi:hypothetical protein
MNESNLNPTVSEFKDRSTGLLVFGVLDILLGAGWLLLMALAVLGQFISARTTGVEPNLHMIVPVVVTYGGLAVILVWLGIGSIKRRRWARALLLILAWSGLIVGVLAGGMMLFLLPRIFRAGLASDQGMPPGALVMVMLFMLLFIGVLLIVIPGVMVFFYGSRHVKATCEASDRQPCWTDACPLPVLAVACWLWFGGLSMLFMLAGNNAMMPLFGALVTGLPGIILYLALAALWFWLGWMCYQLKLAGWWILVGVLVVFMVSSVMTFTRVDLIEMYQKMGYPEAQIEMIRKQGWMTNRLFAWWMPVMIVPMLGYLAWVKRFFNRSQDAGEGSAQPAA